jgi:hypothetical protein
LLGLRLTESGRKRKSAEAVLPLHSADFPRNFEEVLKVLPIASKNKRNASGTAMLAMDN